VKNAHCRNKNTHLIWSPDCYSSMVLLTFSCLNRVRIFISRNVLWQYVWCSNGEIFFTATLALFVLSNADLKKRKETK